MSERPACILRWTEVEGPDDSHYEGDDELMSVGAPLARALGLTRLGIHHERLPPGRRTSYPHAERDEEEFVLVLEGTPDVWLDGHLHRLAPGDAVGFPAGTGLAHAVLNDTDEEVRLLVVGEASRQGSRVAYPLNPEQGGRDDRWDDAPARDLGPHDGLTRARRAARDGQDPA